MSLDPNARAIAEAQTLIEVQMTLNNARLQMLGDHDREITENEIDVDFLAVEAQADCDEFEGDVRRWDAAKAAYEAGRMSGAAADAFAISMGQRQDARDARAASRKKKAAILQELHAKYGVQ